MSARSELLKRQKAERKRFRKQLDLMHALDRAERALREARNFVDHRTDTYRSATRALYDVRYAKDSAMRE